jgi:hypothetical protein
MVEILFWVLYWLLTFVPLGLTVACVVGVKEEVERGNWIAAGMGSLLGAVMFVVWLIMVTFLVGVE